MLAIQNRFDSKIKSVKVLAGEGEKGDELFILDPEQDLKLWKSNAERSEFSIKLRRLEANQENIFEPKVGDDEGIFNQELAAKTGSQCI